MREGWREEGGREGGGRAGGREGWREGGMEGWREGGRDGRDGGGRREGHVVIILSHPSLGPARPPGPEGPYRSAR